MYSSPILPILHLHFLFQTIINNYFHNHPPNDPTASPIVFQISCYIYQKQKRFLNFYQYLFFYDYFSDRFRWLNFIIHIALFTYHPLYCPSYTQRSFFILSCILPRSQNTRRSQTALLSWIDQNATLPDAAPFPPSSPGKIYLL